MRSDGLALNMMVSPTSSDSTRLSGSIISCSTNIAVQVTRPLRRARTTFAAFEASMKNQKDG
jgi:flagellar motor switch protein FliM